MTAADLDAAVAAVLGPGRALRPGQREAIEGVLVGDTLAVLATGTGKTLVYQVAQRLLGRPALVVSPTLSLMADQLAALRAGGTTTERVDSSHPPGVRRRILAAWSAGEIDVLLLSPEQLARDDVVEAVAAGRPGLFVVDEAHCVSAWGEDFRPDYLGLGAVVRRVGRPTVLATTATASPATRAAITTALGLRDPTVVVGDADRAELWLSAHELPEEDAVTAALLARLRDLDGATALVYVATRRRTEELSATLVAAGLPAVAYHGGLARRPREQVEAGFREGTARLVVATSAFGLGVDRPDVRLVAHADPTDDLDDYWQEAGRGGRDGRAAEAVLYTRPDGYGLRHWFAASAGASVVDVAAVVGALQASTGPLAPGDLTTASGLTRTRAQRALHVLLRTGTAGETTASGEPGLTLLTDEPGGVLLERAARFVEDLRERQETGVDLVRRYAETTDCRRRLILELLGESHPDPCGRCDNCAAGTSVEADDRPFAVGSRVSHARWGEGTVTGYEGDRMTVLFEHDGYRALALAVVEQRHLLSPAGSAAPRASVQPAP